MVESRQRPGQSGRDELPHRGCCVGTPGGCPEGPAGSPEGQGVDGQTE